ASDVYKRQGYAPPIAVEFGRKTLYSSERPSFIELEEHVRAVRNPNQQTMTCLLYTSDAADDIALV
ncbi:hypothetical protein Q5N85_19010, partial [Acinetobacter baumannii]|nr:hypothetical protein [Acinetobacter baumannii]